MNLIFIKSNLKEGLVIVEKAVGETSNLPILKNVLLNAKDGKIELTATNLEIAITVAVPGKIIEEGATTVPVAVFKDLVSNLQNERIALESKKDVLEIKTDNYHAAVQGLPSEDFPIIPNIKNQKGSIEIKGGILKDAINQVASSAQFSDLRPELSSVLLDFLIDEIKLVSTDSFRLSEKTVRGSEFETDFEEKFRALIPLKTAQELGKVLKEDEQVTMHKDENQILFKTETMYFISRLTEGSFPDYTAILPQKFESEVILNRQELLNALRLAGVFSSRVNEVKIKIPESKKNIEVFSVDQSLGDNNSLLPAKVQGKPKEVSFNWKYLADGLRALKTEEIFLGINEDNKPALLRSPGEGSYFYVLMPILKGN